VRYDIEKEPMDAKSVAEAIAHEAKLRIERAADRPPSPDLSRPSGRARSLIPTVPQNAFVCAVSSNGVRGAPTPSPPGGQERVREVGDARAQRPWGLLGARHWIVSHQRDRALSGRGLPRVKRT
jgi:hypothetical protein